MTVQPLPPIVLVDPPSSALFAHPPGMLSEMTAFLEAIGWRSCDGSAIPADDTAKGEDLLNQLERIAADHDSTHCFWFKALPPTVLQRLMDALHNRPTPLTLSLACSIGSAPDTDLPIPSKADGIAQIQWQAANRLPELGFFKKVSRAGVWNHLILNGPAATAANRDAVARQPNIIHSWQVTTGQAHDISADDGYSGLPPLPGRPLWQMVDDPIHRFVLIERFGKNWLMRSRVDAAGDRIIRLGEALTYHFCPPDELPQGFLDNICAMVAAGGTVAATHVRSNLERAYLIGYVLENGVIVGNSSLKHPRPQYIENVRRQSGLDLSGFVERGYTSVRPEYRGLGIGTRLLEGLTARAGDRKIFSVIAEDNEATKIIARRNRTRQVARYYSDKAGKPVGIWMPEWMIEGHEK